VIDMFAGLPADNSTPVERWEADTMAREVSTAVPVAVVEPAPLLGTFETATLPGFDAKPFIPSLRDRFAIPPFTVLDSKAGYWQQRRAQWLELGIEGEIGRGDTLLFKGNSQGRLNGILGQRRTAQVDGTITTEEGGKATPDMHGTSVFDPVVCELAYRWYSPPGGLVVDPFAGGSVRGIAAAALGRRYIGAELRKEQVTANRAQWALIGPKLGDVPNPTWINGAAQDVLPYLANKGIQADLVFTCPPYADLEVYSDDPKDLSNMQPVQFLRAHERIVGQAWQLLLPNRYAVWVIGEARSGRTGEQYALAPFTVKAFHKQGAQYYNDHILLTAIGSLPVRVSNQFPRGRKAGRAHQYVYVFAKGDGMLASQACGVLTMEWGVQTG
jgi:DNA methylase